MRYLGCKFFPWCLFGWQMGMSTWSRVSEYQLQRRARSGNTAPSSYTTNYCKHRYCSKLKLLPFSLSSVTLLFLMMSESSYVNVQSLKFSSDWPAVKCPGPRQLLYWAVVVGAADMQIFPPHLRHNSSGAGAGAGQGSKFHSLFQTSSQSLQIISPQFTGDRFIYYC